MTKDKVWVSGHEVKLVIGRWRDEHQWHQAGHWVIYLGFGKLFVSLDLVGRGQGCDKVNKHEVSIVAVFQCLSPILKDIAGVVRLKCVLGGSNDFLIFGDDDVLHIWSIEIWIGL